MLVFANQQQINRIAGNKRMDVIIRVNGNRKCYEHRLHDVDGHHESGRVIGFSKPRSGRIVM